MSLVVGALHVTRGKCSVCAQDVEKKFVLRFEGPEFWIEETDADCGACMDCLFHIGDVLRNCPVGERHKVDSRQLPFDI